MKISYIILLSACLLNITSVMAIMPEVSLGTIHFTGHVFESPCTIANKNSLLSSQCFNNSAIYLTPLPIKAMQTSKGVANNHYIANIVWLNKEKTRAVTTVSYQ